MIMIMITIMIFRRMKHKKYLRKQVEGEDGEARDSEEVIIYIIASVFVVIIAMAIAIILILRGVFNRKKVFLHIHSSHSLTTNRLTNRGRRTMKRVREVDISRRRPRWWTTGGSTT